MTDRRLEDLQKQIAEQMVPSDWDTAPRILATEIRQFLKTVADADTGIDTGGGNGNADLWVTVAGVEFYIQITRSKKEDVYE